MKRNIPLLGLILGLLFPIIGMLVVYLILFRGASFSGFANDLVTGHRIAAKVISLGLIANLLPFMYYTNKRLDYTARRVLIATMLYALLIVLLKFVW